MTKFSKNSQVPQCDKTAVMCSAFKKFFRRLFVLAILPILFSIGLIALIMSQDVLSDEDRPDLGICNYFEPVIQPSTTCEITYTGQTPPVIFIGGKIKTFTAKFLNNQGEEITTPIAVWTTNIADQSKISFKVDAVNPNICTLQVAKDFKLTSTNNIVRLSLTDTTGLYNSFVDIKIQSVTG